MKVTNQIASSHVGGAHGASAKGGDTFSVKVHLSKGKLKSLSSKYAVEKVIHTFSDSMKDEKEKDPYEVDGEEHSTESNEPSENVMKHFDQSVQTASKMQNSFRTFGALCAVAKAFSGRSGATANLFPVRRLA